MNGEAARKIFIAFMGAVFLFGSWLRVDGFLHSMEYDELWALARHVEAPLTVVLSDLIPNNHPLLNILAGFIVETLGLEPHFIRLPDLFAGLLLPPLAALFAWRVFKDNLASLAALALCAFNGALIHYSQSARGYSLQSLFVLLAAFALFAMNGEGRRARRAAPALFFASSLLAVACVPSGAIFIAALCAVWLATRPSWSFKGEWPMLLAFASSAALCLLWLGANRHILLEGRGVGERVEGALRFLAFLRSSLAEIGGWSWPLAFAPLLLKESRRFGSICLAIVLLSLSSALLTRIGPVRVYIPVEPFMALGVAALAAALPRSKPRLVFAGALIAALAAKAPEEKARWTPIDWNEAFPQLARSLPKSCFIAYSRIESYPLRGNFGEAAVSDNLRRIESFGGGIAFAGCDGSLSVLGVANGDSKDFKLPKGSGSFKASNANVEIHALKKLGADDALAGRIVFAVIAPCEAERHDSLAKSLLDIGDWGYVNCWLRSDFQLPGGGDGLAEVLAIEGGSLKLGTQALDAMAETSGGALKLFLLEPHEERPPLK